MLRGLFKLTWTEFKIFLREPMGAVSSFVFPPAVFLLLGNVVMRAGSDKFDSQAYLAGTLPVFVVMVILLNSVVSLTTILSIYREGGILKRLKATPLSPVTILTAHVLVKLMLTSINIGTLLLIGKTYFDIRMAFNPIGFAVAVVVSSVSVLALGFVLASLVRTARYAPPTATVVLYPLLVFSGLFSPISDYPTALRVVAYLSPITYAVRLMRDTWEGAATISMLPSLAALAVAFIACVMIASRYFRWE